MSIKLAILRPQKLSLEKVNATLQKQVQHSSVACRGKDVTEGKGLLFLGERLELGKRTGICAWKSAGEPSTCFFAKVSEILSGRLFQMSLANGFCRLPDSCSAFRWLKAARGQI